MLSDTLTPPHSVSEGAAREWLARQFLYRSLPALDNQKAQASLPCLLRLYWETETRSVLRYAGVRRPLRYGNLSAMAAALMEACRLEAQEQGCLLTVEGAPGNLYAFFEPRLFQLATVGLLRSACASSGRERVAAAIHQRGRRLTLSITGRSRFWDADALLVAKETARLHHGSLAVSENTAAFSLEAGIRADLKGSGLSHTPTAEELRRAPLSLVTAGFQSLESFSPPLLN